jgi:hypothetical protein
LFIDNNEILDNAAIEGIILKGNNTTILEDLNYMPYTNKN